MYEYIVGRLDEITPTEAVIEAAGVGYKTLISLSTFSNLQNQRDATVKVYTYHIVREDDEALYGFFDKNERAVFAHLVSVSGVGPGSARMILSSMNADEVRQTVLGNDVNRFKAVKGIGLKTAQRLILELKDKIGKGGEEFSFENNGAGSALREEAISALTLLGFSKPAVEKVVGAILKETPGITIEEIIKKALKML